MTNELLPVYKILPSLISDDIEHVAHIFANLDAPHIRERIEILNPPSSPRTFPSTQNEQASIDPPVFDLLCRRRHPKRRRCSAESERPFIVHSPSPSLPAIIVTPCPSTPPVTLPRIPLQNRDFGQRLSVPSHPVFNHVFPPMARPAFLPSEPVRWIWSNGHWEAILPGLAEQTEKGLFSKCILRKNQNRTHKAPRSGTMLS